MRRLRFLTLLGTFAAMTAVELTKSTPAHACGGTFCDGGPAAMQVDQTGEVILFAFGDGFVEAHVQIQYDGGDASKFAWIVPVLEVPEVEVGSFRFIQNAMDATVPVYGIQSTGFCDDDGGGGTVGFLQSPDGGSGGGPEVVVHDTVGVFEYVVLQGGTAESIGDWLVANEYAPDDEAPAILDAYIDEGHVFVAFKLLHSAGIEDLHPVVLRYPGDEPCIPLRLTRVAAVDDMPIRALVLTDDRVFPASWRHVLLNRVRLDWVALGANYDELVSLAIDAPGSDGRGFVTEYAGTSAMVDTLSLDTQSFDAGAFVLAPATETIDILTQQGLASCGESGCTWGHELVPSLLHEFLPVPDGLPEHEFYACLSCYADLIDPVAWDAAAFSAAYAERIVAPMDHGRTLLETWPYLTRLYTRVSPHEMTTDPTFVRLEGLADVPNRLGAGQDSDCCGTVVRLPGGREIELPPSGAWPTWPDEMPWAERVESWLPGGQAPAELVNVSAEIDALVAAHNATLPCAGEGGSSGESAGDDDTGVDPSGGGSATGGSSASATGSNDGGTGSTGDDGMLAGGESGCGCTQRAPGRLGALALVVLGLVARRRR